MKFQIKDVIVTTPEYGEREFVIVKLKVSSYLGVSTKTKKRYPIKEEQIAAKIGEVADDDPILQLDYYDIQEGQKYARKQVEVDENNKAKWKFLSMLRPNDKIEVLYKKFIRSATFVKINVTKPLLVFRANIDGELVDLSLDSLHIQT
jgi:hypothetical protein